MDSKRQAVTFAVYARYATRIEAWVYRRPQGEDQMARLPLTRDGRDVWRVEVSLAYLQAQGGTEVVYYGYRAWGPNWPFTSAWRPGTEIGFVCDVDGQGNRFNPNKLLIDPYAIELSHDPAPRLSWIDPNEYVEAYYSGQGFRHLDTGRIAPKSVLPPGRLDVPTGGKPRRTLRDDIIYEVHVRGFTRADPSIPEPYRGTFRGAGMKASYLKTLGVTAVEFLPVFHFASEQNDDGDPRGDNYWGYMTLGYFAPNRRYAADQTPGGPTREFKDMVRAFHNADIKVFLDVVYNHTGEGLLKRTTEDNDSRGDDTKQVPACACILAWRGLDNATYYTLRSRPDLDGGQPNQRYQDNSACGPSLNVANEVGRDFILDSLRYWAHDMGVDGFRFDLAPVLGNRLDQGGFVFDWRHPQALLPAIGRLPGRTSSNLDGIDLIAEPWAVGDGTYQLGHFPDGWAEWNDVYRQVVRRAQNKLHVHTVLPWEMANVIAGSAQQFQLPGGRTTPHPCDAINYVASHDGLTLRDVFSYTNGEDAWDHGGAQAQQRQAVRNALVLLMTAAGVPMFMGGDELFRTLQGRPNTVAVDDDRVYLDWRNFQTYTRAQVDGDTARLAALRQQDDIRLYEFTREMIRLRQTYGALRPQTYFTGQVHAGSNLKDITWYDADGREMAQDWHNPEAAFLGFRIDNTMALDAATVGCSIYVAYNWRDAPVTVVLPPNLPGVSWRRMVDTAAWLEAAGNVDRDATVIASAYGLHTRSMAIFVET